MGRSPRRSSQVVEGLNRGAWTSIEDKTLIDYVKSHGEGKWSNVSKVTGLRRCGKSCRLRWMNYLRPDIKRGNISADEEELILRLHKLLGNRWALIAGRLPGRTDNEVKNYWNTHLAKKAQDQTLPTPLITGLPSNTCPPPDHHSTPQVLRPPPTQHNYDQSSMLSSPNVSLVPNGMVNDTTKQQPESSDRSSPLTCGDSGQDFVMDFNIDDIYTILDPGFARLNGVVLSDLNTDEGKPGTGLMGSDTDLRSLATFLESDDWLAVADVNVTCEDEQAGR